MNQSIGAGQELSNQSLSCCSHCRSFIRSYYERTTLKLAIVVSQYSPVAFVLLLVLLVFIVMMVHDEDPLF